MLITIRAKQMTQHCVFYDSMYPRTAVLLQRYFIIIKKKKISSQIRRQTGTRHKSYWCTWHFEFMNHICIVDYVLMKIWENLPAGESWPPDGWKGHVKSRVWRHTNPNTHLHRLQMRSWVFPIFERVFFLSAFTQKWCCNKFRRLQHRCFCKAKRNSEA